MGSVKLPPLPSRAHDIYDSIHNHSPDIWGSIHSRKLKHSYKCLQNSSPRKKINFNSQSASKHTYQKRQVPSTQLFLF